MFGKSGPRGLEFHSDHHKKTQLLISWTSWAGLPSRWFTMRMHQTIWDPIMLAATQENVKRSSGVRYGAWPKMPMSPPPFARIRSLLSCRAWVCTAQSKLRAPLDFCVLPSSHWNQPWVVQGCPHRMCHSGDAWNDLVHLLAKQERVKSTMKNHNY